MQKMLLEVELEIHRDADYVTLNPDILGPCIAAKIHKLLGAGQPDVLKVVGGKCYCNSVEYKNSTDTIVTQ